MSSANKNGLRHIIDFILKYKYMYLGGVVCLLIVDGLQLALPKILGRVTDLLKANELTKEILVQYSLIIIALSVGIAVFRFLWRYMIYGTAKKIETLFRNRFYEHLQGLSVNYYNHHKTGDLMAHATNDINNVRMALGQGTTMAVDSSLIPVVAVIMLFGTGGAKLSLLSLSPLLLLALVMIVNVRKMHGQAEKMQEAFSELTERARENFSGIRVIKAFAQEESEVRKFERSNTHNLETNLKFARTMQTLFPMVMAISSLSFAIALWYGGILVLYKEITLGDFVAFNGYLGMLIWPTAALGWIASIFQRGSVSLDRINAILDEKPEIVDKSENADELEKIDKLESVDKPGAADKLDTAGINKIEGKITFNNITFTYPGTDSPVLKNINITVEKGKTLAIVGSTGSGKSTLANLVLRLYDLETGALEIDDTDISKVPLEVLRNNIGYVPQDTFLFSTSIRDNIDFFQNREENAIIKASQISKVYDNIMEFPNKFSTMVGERGVTLSGGQKQRIAIARAILREPSILILDDCLSAVDTNTEEEILRGLREIMQQRTSIIISHRIFTIKDADEIIVLEDGEIVERGNHQSLLDNQKLYYDLYRKQLLREQIEGEE